MVTTGASTGPHRMVPPWNTTQPQTSTAPRGRAPALDNHDGVCSSFSIAKQPVSSFPDSAYKETRTSPQAKERGTHQQTERSPHLPPRLLGLGLGGHLHPIGLQGQVEHCHGYVLSPEAEAQPPVVAVPQQGPGSDGNGGPLPAVTVQPVLEGNQVVEQVLQRHTSQPMGLWGSGPQDT